MRDIEESKYRKRKCEKHEAWKPLLLKTEKGLRRLMMLILENAEEEEENARPRHRVMVGMICKIYFEFGFE